MQYNRNFDFAAGQTIVADQVDMEFDSIAGVINGNIDTDNIADEAVTTAKMESNANPETRLAETGSDFVSSGMALDPASGWGASQLTATITAGVAYISGKRVSISSIVSHPFTASKDTYVDIDSNGTIYYDEKTSGATAPTLPSGRMRLACVKTDANKITAYLTGRIVAGANSGEGTIIARPVKALSTPMSIYALRGTSQNPSSQTGDQTYSHKYNDHYSALVAATGIFTAPFNGYFNFMFTGFTNNTNSTGELRYIINGVNQIRTYSGVANNYTPISLTGTFYMKTGDTIKVQTSSNFYLHVNEANHWTITYLGQ